MSSLSAAKLRLRREVRAARAALSWQETTERSRSALCRLLGVLPLAPERVVACFWPMPGELDTRLLLEALARLEVATALPRVTGKGRPLQFHRWQPGDPLLRGPMGVEEPMAAASAVVPDIVLVPLVAFDDRGHRLGYGAGFYDRTLAAFDPMPVVIGLAFEMQRLPAVPAGDTDFRLPAVVTDAAVHRFD